MQLFPQPHQSLSDPLWDSAPKVPKDHKSISVLVKSWHIPQRFHGHPNMGGTSPSKGASPTKPNHRHPRATQRAKPCPSVRPALLTAGVPRALTCLGSPPLLQAQPLAALTQCRTELSGSRAAHSGFVQPSQGHLVGIRRSQSWMDPAGSGTADPAQELLPEGAWWVLRSGMSEEGGRFSICHCHPSERAAWAFKRVHHNSTLSQEGHSLEVK